MTRTCARCKHFWTDDATPHYSDVEPGSEFSMYCGERHWLFDPFRPRLSTLEKIFTAGQDCPDYANKASRG